MQPDARVGYVLKMYPRFSETFIVTELLAMQANGIDLEVFSLRPPVDGRFHGSLAHLRAPVTYVRSSGIGIPDVWDTMRAGHAAFPEFDEHVADLLAADARDAVQAVELALAVRERGVTHLHAHFASLPTTVARLAARLTDITYSVTAHAKDIFHEDIDPAELRRKLEDAHEVITVSDFNLAFLCEKYGTSARRARRVYNGLDLDSFPYSEPAERPAVIAAVGRLVEKKGFSDLLDAALIMRESGRAFSIELVGTGAEEPALRAQVDRLGLGDRVRMHGALPQAEVGRIVGGAAAFAAPCVVGADGNRDGLPTVLLEAMALGTPCVATPVTGIPEVVEDDHTGLIVPEHDPVALADALGRLLDDPGLRTDLARAARKRIETDFDCRRQAELVADSFGTTGVDRLAG